jgi:hypothetical protein
MSAAKVKVADRALPIRRTSTQRLRTTFTLDGRQYQAIEQNPEKPSRWGKLARSGYQVVQFEDVEINRFCRSPIASAKERLVTTAVA